MLEAFSDAKLFAAAIAKVDLKLQKRHASEALIDGGPSVHALASDAPELAPRLASLVASGRYAFSDVTPVRARIEGRMRVLFRSPALDLIVLTALADQLSPLLEPVLSPRLFSYRKGYSPKQALFELADFVRKHCKERPDPRTRGVYVVRRDVKAYGDSVPAGPDAALWTILKRALVTAGQQVSDAEWIFLKSAFRPGVREVSDLSVRADLGIPTGSPLQTLVANLYLGAVDKRHESTPGSFYARFGDDILFASPDADVAHAASIAIDAELAALGLALSSGKCSELYLTACGRPGDARFRPVSNLTYLGMRVDGRAQLGMSREKLARFLHNVDRRLSHVAALLATAPAELRARTLCTVSNAAWNCAEPTCERAAEALTGLVTDRAQLRDLDYQLALRVAQKCANKRGPRAFRVMPIRTLRRQHGLASLEYARNRQPHEERPRG
jgi:hypothetical protein